MGRVCSVGKNLMGAYSAISTFTISLKLLFFKNPQGTLTSQLTWEEMIAEYDGKGVLRVFTTP